METVQDSIECRGSALDASRTRVVLFDFDGTLSLIRSGWVDVMVPMMVECLLQLKTGESEQELTDTVADYVARLTGKQTIYQMIELAGQIRRRGGQPLEPLEYKHMYLSKLSHKIKDRVGGLRNGACPPEEFLVPGARRLLEALRERGLKLYLASGTDQPYLREEVKLLRVDSYFDGRIFGALDDYESFSKKMLIDKIISESDFAGEEFLAFGDGYVEIQNVKEVGGVAAGVATDEPLCTRVDEVKRQRLLDVGADWIIPNFLAHEELMKTLFP